MRRGADKEETAKARREGEPAPPRRSPTVLPYLIVLVLAAFLLLVMAYLMQLRTAQSVEGLSQSVSSIQSIDQLVEDNRTLHQRVDALEAELEEAEDRRLALERALEEVNAQLAAAQGELDALRAEASPSPAP